MLVAVGSILISVFQFEEETSEVPLGNVIATGVFIGMPVATILGAAIGVVWDFFDRRSSRGSGPGEGTGQRETQAPSMRKGGRGGRRK